MILIGLLFFCAFALSGAAAFYSIAGLMAIFAAAPIPIAIMGTTLEVSKLVVASWLYRNWKPVPVLLKGYLTFALFVLMFLTSMGIFGYLSKAHLDQGVPTGDVAAKVALIDEKIKTEKENIDAARKAIAQLDEQVNQTLSRTATQSNDAGVNRSVAIRRGQAKERTALTKEIEQAQARVTKLNEERAPAAAELRKVEAEVGPIKYIAALIYGDEATQDSTLLEKAVRWVTILIVAVFDPLAVVMLIAANWSFANRKKLIPENSNEKDETILKSTSVVESQITDAVTSQPPAEVVHESTTAEPVVAAITEPTPVVEQQVESEPITPQPTVAPEEPPTVVLPNPTLGQFDKHTWRSRPR